MTPIRLVMADDHTLFRAGIRALLEGLEGIVVVAETGDGQEALRLISIHRPDVALLDITMPGLNGLDLTARIKAEYPHVHVIILSMHASKEYVLQALRAGAAAYVLKDADTVELVLALNAVMRGEIYLSPAVSKHVVAAYVQHTPTNPPDQLS